jgi:hypothetical protein
VVSCSGACCSGIVSRRDWCSTEPSFADAAKVLWASSSDSTCWIYCVPELLQSIQMVRPLRFILVLMMMAYVVGARDSRTRAREVKIAKESAKIESARGRGRGARRGARGRQQQAARQRAAAARAAGPAPQQQPRRPLSPAQ